MKKKIALLLATSLLCASFTGIFTGCAPASVKDGTLAAKLLLANKRLNSQDLNAEAGLLAAINDKADIAQGGGKKALKAEEQGLKGFSRIDQATKLITDARRPFADGHQSSGGVHTWTEFPDYSNSVLYFSSFTKSIAEESERFAAYIDEVKESVNVTDKWVRVKGESVLLTVDGTKETIYVEQTEDQYTVCSRSTSEQAQTVYELYTNYKDPEYTSNTRMKYIPNAYYEYAHEQPETDFNHYVVIDNSRGYWNMSSFWLSESIGSGVLQNLVSTEDACYQFVTDFRQGEEFNFYYTILSPDLSTDLLTIFENDSRIQLQLNGFNGIQSARSFAESDVYEEDGEVSGLNLELVLNNGDVLSPQTAFLDGAVKYDYTDVRHMNLGDVYAGEMQFEVEGASVKERLQRLQEVLSSLGVTGKHDMSSVIDCAPEAVTQAHNFGSYYTWNGRYFDSYEGILEGIKVEREKYAVYEEAYQTAQQAPSAGFGEGENLPNNLDFASVASLTGNATYTGGALSVENLSLTVEDLTLFKEGESYQLVLALAKKENGAVNEALVVPFAVEEPNVTAYTLNQPVTVSQTATYQLSDKLSSGEYAVVAYAATADGIRVSQLKELTFTAAADGALEYTGASVKATLTAENALLLTYEMKVDLWISPDEEKLIYTKAETASLLLSYVLSYGYPIEESVLELYDENTQTATAVAAEELSSGVYRLKYYRMQDEQKMEGYVYCRLP